MAPAFAPSTVSVNSQLFLLEKSFHKRKSWLFSTTKDGAKASAMVYSLMLTCRACGVEPHAWLLHVLKELPQRASDADITDLLPFNYAKQQAEVGES